MKVILYSESNLKGNTQELQLGSHTISELKINQLGSIQVPHWLRVTFYSDDAYGNRLVAYSNDVRSFKGIVDSAQAIVVEPLPNFDFALVARHSKKILQVQDASTSEGANVVQYGFEGGEHQRIRLTPIANDPGFFKISFQHSNKVLGYELITEGQIQRTYLSQQSWTQKERQKWRLHHRDKNYFLIINKESKKAIDVPNQRSDDNLVVGQYTVTGHLHQQFLIERVINDKLASSYLPEQNKEYSIYSRHNKPIGLADNATFDGAEVVQHAYRANIYSQRFQFANAKLDRYKIKSTHSGKFIGVPDGNTGNGTAISQEDWQNREGQEWRLALQEDGYFRFLIGGTPLNMDLPNGSAADGTKIQQWAINGNLHNQSFRLEPLGPVVKLQITDPVAKRSTLEVDLTASPITAGSEAGTFTYFLNEELTEAIPDPTQVASGTYWIQLTTADHRTIAKQVTVPPFVGYPEAGKEYAIYPKSGNFVLSANNENTQAGTLVVQHTFALDHYSQRFELIPLGEPGLYKIKNTISGRFLSVPANNNRNDEPVTLEDWQDQAYQKWKLSPREGGYYFITVEHSNSALDVHGRGKLDGAYLKQFSPHGEANQLFRFEPLPPLPNLVITNPSEERSENAVDLADAAITQGSEAGTFTYFRDKKLTQAIPAGEKVGPGEYWIKLTTGDGRSIAKPVTVPIRALPELVLHNPAAVCADKKIDLRAAAITAGSDEGTLSYYLDEALTQAVPDPAAVEAGDYYVKLTIGGGRFSSGKVTVSTHPLPKLVVHTPAPICWDHKLDLTAPAITAGSDGNDLSYFADKKLTKAVTDPKSVEAGTFYIQLKNQHGCTTVQSIVVTARPEPKLEVANPPAVCWDKKVDLTATGVVTAQDPGEILYFSDEACRKAISNSAAVAGGTHYIQLKTAEGCTKVKSVVATIWPEPKLVITAPKPVCWDKKVDLTADAITAGSDHGTLTYFKDKALTQSLADPKAVGSGTYYIRIETERGCVTKRPVQAEVRPRPELETKDSVEKDAPAKVDLTEAIVKQDQGTVAYFRDLALTEVVDNPQAVSAGDYYLQLTDTMGCKSAVRKVKAINPKATLVVPLYLKGIHVPKATTTVGPTADFSYLPWNDGSRDYNPDYAPLGEYIETTPLQSANGRLQAGIHLHWTLPPALSSQVKGTDGQKELPYVPVEWDVVPLAQNGTGQRLPEEKVWSEYLHSEVTPLNLKYAQVPLAPKPKRQPFRYMGTATARNKTPEIPAGEEKVRFYREAEFLNHPLTSFGYGSMSFAPFYPDCREVFGHHVPLDSEDHAGLASVTYMVRATLYRVEGGNYPLNKMMDKLNISLEELLQQFKWPLTGGGVPKEIHLAGVVQVSTDQALNQTVDRSTSGIQFSLGQTGTEALSAYLASELGEEYGLRQKMEEQLEAILMGDQITGHAADLSLKFLEKRHAHGFRELSGGHKWTVQAKKPAGLGNESFPLQYLDPKEKKRTITRLVKSNLKPLLTAIQQDEESLNNFKQLIDNLATSSEEEVKATLQDFLDQKPASIPKEKKPLFDALAKLQRQIAWLDHLEQVSEKLIALNLKQLEYEQETIKVSSMKRELFGDWYKYMLAKYPPPESLEQFETADFPPAGEVAAWLQHRAKAIATQIEDTGKAAIKGAGTNQQASISVAHAGEVTNDLAGLFNTLKDAADTPSAKEVKAQITHQPAAPFYTPTDPVLLIAGLDIPEPQLRQAPLKEDYYTIQRFSDTANSTQLNTLSQLMEDSGISKTGNAAWEPFILEWQAEFLPIVDRNDKNSPQNRFTLKENREDTELRSTEGYQNSPATTMRGRTFLTPGAKARKLQVLREFLALQLPPFSQSSRLAEVQVFWQEADQDYRTIIRKPDSTSAAPEGYEFILGETYAFSQEQEGTKPVKLFYSPLRKDTVLVATPKGESDHQGHAYSAEAIEAYVFEVDGPGRKPLKLYWNRTKKDNLTTASEELAAEALASGYEFIRIEGYVLDKNGSLNVRAEEYIHSKQRPFDTNDTVLTAARAYLRLQDEIILSQSLGGFNDGMLQLEHHLQPNLQDPLGTEEEQVFTQQLGTLIAGESRLAPNPAKPFLPARAGSFRLTGLRLIDTWGRYRDLLEKREFEAILSEPLSPIGAKAGWAGMPLRVTQPLRLHANWLAAKKHNNQDVSLEDLPYASPIVGWISNNPLDRSLMYFDAQGDALGYFNRQGDQGAPPGKNDDFTFDIPALQHVLDHAKDNEGWLQSFIDATENALAHIAPTEHHLHKGIAMLTGRPMAVVRVKLSFELMGLPAHDRTWAALRDQIDRLQHGEEDLHTHWQHMRFPIRLGNYMMLNDGLVGFWQEDANGDHVGPLYTMANRTDRPDILPHNKETLLWLPLNGESITLTLLVDPRGSVHVTSGVLPVQNLQFRKGLITPALERISTWFLQAPLLQPKGATDVLRLRPPLEPGYEWRWLEATNDHHANADDEWRELEEFQPADKKASFDQDSELREGWLILDHE